MKVAKVDGKKWLVQNESGWVDADSKAPAVLPASPKRVKMFENEAEAAKAGFAKK